MTNAQISPEDLRELVGQAVRELLPSLRPPGGGAQDARHAGPIGNSRPPAQTEAVRLDTDADLAEFVRRLAALCGDRGQREAILEGRIGFALARSGDRGVAVKPIRRIQKGAVTEAMVAAAAEAGETLWLSRRATLTPLAKDRVRALGIEVTKES